MNFEKFEPIFTLIYKEYQKRDEFLDLVPLSLRESVFDNEYTNSLEFINDRLIDSLFSEEVASDINYFLYDWKIGFMIIRDDIEYVINDFEDMLKYFKKNYKTF